MTPVSSPTPDEQAAEDEGLTSLRCRFCGWVDSHDPACIWIGPRRPEDFTAVPPPPPTAAELTAQVADLRASLVVVREQLTQAQARIATVNALCKAVEDGPFRSMLHGGGFAPAFIATDRVRAALGLAAEETP